MMKTKRAYLNLLTIASILLSVMAWNAAATGAATAETLGIILYVKQDASATGTCSAWADPCGLQAALTAAVSGDEIWVAAGTYYPDSTGLADPREATFRLKNSVALYGGFAGTETNRDQRDPTAHPTTLSGDLGAVGDNSDNAYHVVTGSGTDAGAILDGFTIRAGNANGGDQHDNGGGMYNSSGSPTLTGVTFSGNSAGYGGGMFNDSSSPTLTNVTFSGNSAFVCGGGMFNDSSSPTLINSIVWGNTPVNLQIIGGAAITYSAIQGGWSGEGNINTDPLLGPLADNGGFTLTHDLLPGSPAIDAGSLTVCPATDQRGAARPIDGDGMDGARCDMGAVEYMPKVFLPLVRR